ncbi:MAG TPA: cupin domain-containing protein [Candidatus Acidoferrales bacterium]|nr:cupin domain-containing protein [Candidatus Acidoferrales bacterium]
MSSPIRRVVTGKDAAGKAITIMDGPATSVHHRPEGGLAITNLWVTDSTPADLANPEGTDTRKVGIPPPPSGTIFRIVEFAPEKEITADYETRLKMIQAIGLAPEGLNRDRPRDPAMHRTRTIDYAIIVSGEIDMLLDDTEVHMKAGDVLVQRGTNHAWVNRSSAPCKVAFILVDAKD